jgi:UMF1 family MFS transporter
MLDWEVIGWYTYEFAVSAFQYSILNFLPILVTNQASDYTKEKYPNNTWAVNYAEVGECSKAGLYNFSTCDAGGGEWDATWKEDAQSISFFGVNHNYASIVQSAVFVSIVLEIIFLVLMGPLADYRNFRKNLLILFHLSACVCLFAVYFLKDPGHYQINAVILIASNLFFGLAGIFYNSYLPLLVQETVARKTRTEEVVETGHMIEMVATRTSSGDLEYTNNDSSREIQEATSTVNSVKQESGKIVRKTANHLSTIGFVSGFVGILLIMGMNAAILFTTEDKTNYTSTRANILADTGWLVIFGLVAFYFLKPRRGLDADSAVFFVGMKRLWGTLKKGKQLSQLFLFLGAYFVYSDGFSTTSAAAIQFALVEMKLELTQVMTGVIATPIAAIIGCKLFEWLNRSKGICEKTIVLCCNLCVGVVPIYGYFFMTEPIEFYVAAAIVGFFSGPTQAYTRSIFATVIPQNHESEFFSLFEVTNKGTAWLGPLIISIVLNITGSYRDAFIAIAPFFYIGAAILWFFDYNQARKQRDEFVDST